MECKICKSRYITHYKKIIGFDLLKCKQCKVIFLKNLDDFASTQNLYGKDYFEDYLYETEINFDAIKSTAKYYLDYLVNRFGEINSVLDVGAGFGLFVKAFRECGLEAEGVEISEYSVQIGKEKFGVDISNCNLIEFNTEKKFDLICFYHSFEHLSNPLQNLQKAKELLSANGILWLALPNVMSLDRFIQKENWNGWSLPYHLFHYSPHAIKNLLSLVEFRQIIIQKSFFNPLRLIRKKQLSLEKKYNQLKYSKWKEIIRTPATLLLSGQNMNVFAMK